MLTFERLESSVRWYARSFPAVFAAASGSLLRTEDGREVIDFLSGAGALNYGHNHPSLVRGAIRYLLEGGIVHGLDLATTARRRFLETFDQVVLEPRGLTYRMQFTGPTGTNAVEAAIKLAWKFTGREGIVRFDGSYHGMTLGSLAISEAGRSNRASLRAAFPVHTAAFDDGCEPDLVDLAELAAWMDSVPHESDLPAAVIVETVQADGGVRPARLRWLKTMADIVQSRGVLLIVDDIQAGCGRTGPFFSFEPAGIRPDIVCLSKSLSGMGLPLSMNLVARRVDQWAPGEHTGTFRGNNLALVTATGALELWRTPGLESLVAEHEGRVHRWFADLRTQLANPSQAKLRGRGLLQGIVFPSAEVARRVSREAFERGVMAETCGSRGEVLKLLPPLVISPQDLLRGLERIGDAIRAVLGTIDPDTAAELAVRPRTRQSA